MDWILVSLAEIWRVRRRVGLPLLVGALLGIGYAVMVPPMFEARTLLQVKAEQAHAPMLQHISAAGHRQALFQLLTNPDLLADAAHDAKRPLSNRGVTLEILNDHLLAIGYRSPDSTNLEQVVDGIAFNFIQAVLAPERLQLEQALATTLQETKTIQTRLADQAEASEDARAPLEERLKTLHEDEMKLRDNLQMVNIAFGQRGGETLIWFAEPATVTPPLPQPLRIAFSLLVGALLGLLVGYATQGGQASNAKLVNTPADAADVTSLPLVGTLPFLGKLAVTPQGLRVKTQGKTLNPADFGEVGRIQRALLRGLRGPLVIIGAKGQEGSSTLALLLAEKAAQTAKKVILVDLNLKNRTLSQWLGLGDGNWELPTTKGKAAKAWDALTPLQGTPNLFTLAAPRHPHTLQALAESGGLPVLFDLLSEQADVIIVDASPLAALNRGNVDAVAVAVAASRTAIIAQAGESTKEDLKRATDSLLLAGAPLLGVVLNQEFVLTRRQLLAQLADAVGKVLPPLARLIRKAALSARLD